MPAEVSRTYNPIRNRGTLLPTRVTETNKAMQEPYFTHPAFDQAQREIFALAALLGVAEKGKGAFLEVIGGIRPFGSDGEGWYREWSRRAETERRVASALLEQDRAKEARDGFLLAALMYQAAGRFLDQTSLDPRRSLAEGSSAACFRVVARILQAAGSCEITPDERHLLFLPELNEKEYSAAPMLFVLGDASPVERYALVALPMLRQGVRCLMSMPAPGISIQKSGSVPFLDRKEDALQRLRALLFSGDRTTGDIDLTRAALSSVDVDDKGRRTVTLRRPPCWGTKPEETLSANDVLTVDTSGDSLAQAPERLQEWLEERGIAGSAPGSTERKGN